MSLFIHFLLYTLHFKIKITYKKFTYKELFVIIAIVLNATKSSNNK